MTDTATAAVRLPPASVDFNALNDALGAGKSPDEARAAAIDTATVALTTEQAAAQAARSAAEVPSLAGMNKSELLDRAELEHVTQALDDDRNLIPVADATNARIREAIEAKRRGEILPRAVAEGEMLTDAGGEAAE